MLAELGIDASDHVPRHLDDELLDAIRDEIAARADELLASLA